MSIHCTLFTIRIGKRECLFFIYTTHHKYGVTWDDMYGWDYGVAKT